MSKKLPIFVNKMTKIKKNRYTIVAVSACPLHYKPGPWNWLLITWTGSNLWRQILQILEASSSQQKERKVLPPLHSRVQWWSPIDLNSFPMALPGLGDRHWKCSKSPFLARVIRVQSSHKKRENAWFPYASKGLNPVCIAFALTVTSVTSHKVQY